MQPPKIREAPASADRPGGGAITSPLVPPSRMRFPLLNRKAKMMPSNRVTTPRYHLGGTQRFASVSFGGYPAICWYHLGGTQRFADSIGAIN